MSRTDAVLSWLEDRSDWLSPIVVKEVRQVVRGREFNYSFGASLVVGLTVGFFGAADALTGSGTAGLWTFVALMACLGVLGLGVVPLGAFSALRNERLERTLDLITLTALTPRRVLLGKLLAQGVKLLTLFAGIAPFIAMSFLLGGIDFVSILVWLAVLFMWSMWACALCLFLSTLFRSRAMSGLVFGAFGLALFLLFGLTRSLFFVTRLGPGVGVASVGADFWWTIAVATTFCLVSMVNLVLLGENRLTLPSENRVTRLRVGFLVQFLLIVGWMLTLLDASARTRSNAVEPLGILCGLHLMIVALFTVTEDLRLPRRAVPKGPPRLLWRLLGPFLLPGGGRGAAYVLAQMGILLAAAVMLGANDSQFRFLLAICGYICFFTGAPAVVLRFLSPDRPAIHLRVAILLTVLASTLLPDLLHYMLWGSDVLDLSFGGRHLVNPFRTLANWTIVERYASFFVPLLLGLTGVSAYLLLIQAGARAAPQPVRVDPVSPAAAGEAGSAKALN